MRFLPLLEIYMINARISYIFAKCKCTNLAKISFRRMHNISLLHFVLIFGICFPASRHFCHHHQLNLIFCMRFFKFNFFSNHPAITNCVWLNFLKRNVCRWSILYGKLGFNTNYIPKLFGGKTDFWKHFFARMCVYDCELVFRPKKPNFLDYRHERKIDRMNFSQWVIDFIEKINNTHSKKKLKEN